MHYPVPWQCAEKFKSSEQATQTRDFFQLVIALYHEKTQLESLSQQDIVLIESFNFILFKMNKLKYFFYAKKAANIWIVHLKDQKLDTKVIYNFLKCCNSKIVNINVSFNRPSTF